MTHIFDFRARLPPTVSIWEGLKTVDDFLELAVTSLPGTVQVGRWEADDDANELSFDADSLAALKARVKKENLAPYVVIHMKWVHRGGDSVMVHLSSDVLDDSPREIAVMFHFEDKAEAQKMEDRLQHLLFALKHRRSAWADLVITGMSVDDHERERREERQLQAAEERLAITSAARDSANARADEAQRALSEREATPPRARRWLYLLGSSAVGLATAVGGGVAVGFVLFQFGWI